jgi:tRNA G18 (ribose-2'-O)-methylase SpoU
MSRVPITDLDDPRIAVYRNLKATNQTRRRDEFIVEGQKLLERLIASRFPVVSALTTERREAAVARLVPPSVPLYVVHQSLVDLLVGFNFHQGVLGCGRRRPWPDLATIVGPPGDRLTLVVCPRMDNPENLGALIRLADVFGIDAILVGPRCPNPLSRRVLRVSMGTALRIPTITDDDLYGTMRTLRESAGITFAAATTDADAIALGDFRRPSRLGLVLGCEGSGLGSEWTTLCDHALTIPMRPGADSLNLAVAAGILLYHLTADRSSR